VYIPEPLKPEVAKLKAAFKATHGLGDVAVFAKPASSYTVEQLHEALKGAAVVANHASRRIRELEAALDEAARLAEFWWPEEATAPADELVAKIRALKNSGAALLVAQLETNEKTGK
jgi:hypothetical protein